MPVLTVVVRLAVRLTVAALVAAAVGLGVSAPAQAAICGSASGVSVVVDFHQLGGGVQADCDANGAGKYAAAQFADVGHAITYVQRQPGFVCRVDGAPASDPCVNTPPSDAYWSLWWSDGKSGTWTYSASGVGSLKVPEGGYVALSWQQGDAKAKPRVTPTAHSSPSPTPSPEPSHTPTPSPTHAPTHPPTRAPTHPAGEPPVTTPTSSAATPSGTRRAPDSDSANPTTSGSRSQQGGGHGHTHAQTSADAGPGGSQQPDPTQAGTPLDRGAAPASETSSGSGSGLPGWVAPAVVVLVFATAGSVALVRRRRSRGA